MVTPRQTGRAIPTRGKRRRRDFAASTRSTNNNNNNNNNNGNPSPVHDPDPQDGNSSDSDAQVRDQLLSPHPSKSSSPRKHQQPPAQRSPARRFIPGLEPPTPSPAQVAREDENRQQVEPQQDETGADDESAHEHARENQSRKKRKKRQSRGEQVDENDGQTGEQAQDVRMVQEQEQKEEEEQTRVAKKSKRVPKVTLKPRSTKGNGKRKAKQDLFNRSPSPSQNDDREDEDGDVEEEPDGGTDYDEPPRAQQTLDSRKVKKPYGKKRPTKKRDPSSSVPPKKKKNTPIEQETFVEVEEEEDIGRAASFGAEPEEEEEEFERQEELATPAKRLRSSAPPASSNQKPRPSGSSSRRRSEVAPTGNSSELESDQPNKRKRKKPTTKTKSPEPTFNHWQPPEEHDRPNNPEREHSFTHWSRNKRKFVADKIWLHSDAHSWRYLEKGPRYDSRDKVVRLIEGNGGRVVGSSIEEIKGSNLVVPPMHEHPDYETIWRKADKYDDIIIVNKLWISRSILLQEDGETPGYRCNPLNESYSCPSLDPLRHLPGTSPVSTRIDVRGTRTNSAGEEVSTDEGKFQVIYRVSAEEERYWEKLARKVETGKKGARMSKTEMFERMERKFIDKYLRNWEGYSVLYDTFKGILLERKKAKYPAPKTKKARRILAAVKLFSSGDESGEETNLGGFDAEEDKENRQSHDSFDAEEDDVRRGLRQTKLTNPFVKKKSRAQIQQEAEDAQKDGTAGREDEQEQLTVGDKSSELERTEEEAEPLNPQIVSILATEYGRPMNQVWGIWFYTSMSERRARIVLDRLRKAERLPKTEQAAREKLVDEAKDFMFSVQQDDLLLKVYAGARGDEQAMKSHANWAWLRGYKGWSDKDLMERLELLYWEGTPWDVAVPDKAHERLKAWYPNERNL